MHTKRVSAWLLATALWCSVSTADPLHQFGTEGAWRHEFSGWQFAKQVGGFSRVMQPYTIDGNNDAGVRYEKASGGPRLSAVVEIYLADSAAPDAKLAGAKASAERKAGESAHVKSEAAFQIGERSDVRGTKVTYVADGQQSTSLYFFEASRWTVKVLGSADAPDDEAFDAFVRALPWNTLGDPSALH